MFDFVSLSVIFGIETLTVIGSKNTGGPSTVLIIVDGKTEVRLTEEPDGDFDVTFPHPAPGMHTIVVHANNCSAATSIIIPGSISLSVTKTGFPPHILLLLSGNKSTGGPADIWVYVDGVLTKTLKAMADGGYTLSMPMLEGGPHSIAVKSGLASTTVKFTI